jgi:hypothetical protein
MFGNSEGELRFRKKALDVVGAKRKRCDSMAHPNKRSAIEEINFKSLRVG